MSETVCLVTCPTPALARRLASDLVRGRLAACGSVVPGLTSVYRWKGKVETAREALLVLKSTSARTKRLVARVKALHPYEVPEVLVLKVAGGLPAYLAWVRESVR